MGNDIQDQLNQVYVENCELRAYKRSVNAHFSSQNQMNTRATTTPNDLLDMRSQVS